MMLSLALQAVSIKTRTMDLLFIAFIIMLVTGCTPVHTVILTPDQDGHLGKAEVLTDGGKQLLETPYGMTTVSSRSSAPSSVTTASAEFIATRFADVMAIEPPAPEKFILYFQSNTTELTASSSAIITDILASIKRRGAVSISISGHTDATGSHKLNESLARGRAKYIGDLLIRKGVAEERLTVSSHGKGNQLIPTTDGVSEPRNRRVEVIVR